MNVNAPLTDEDLTRLDDFLSSDASGEESLYPDEIHGLMTAMICGPEMIVPSEWMPLVFAGDPDFADARQAEDIMGLLMRMHNSIASTLQAGTEYQPLLPQSEDIEDADSVAEGWCRGFMMGMSLRGEQWMEHLEGDLGNMLFPIIALAGEPPDFSSEEDPIEPISAEEMTDLCDMLPDSVAAVYAFWRAH